MKYIVLLLWFFFHFSALPFSQSLLFSCFSFFFFFFSRSKLQPPCWCILKMIIHWDWASLAEHAQGSLITPAVIDKNKRSGEGRRGERQEFHWATTKNTVKSSPPPPPPPPHAPPSHRLRQPFNLLAVKIARSSSHPGREIYWGILIIVCLQLSLIQTTLSLMRSFISASQFLCYTVALDVPPSPS